MEHLKTEVLNGGVVEVIDVLGSDLTVVNAARVSFGKRKTELDEADKKLIRYLAKHNHWTPFGQPQIQFRLKMDIATARQFMRHNIGIVYNEKSGRYCEMGDAEMYLPLEFRQQAVSNRQASTDEIVEDTHGRLTDAVSAHYENSLALYKRLRHEGVCKEQARLVLPVATFTEIYCTMSLAALARIINLRDKPDAQYEIRQYAQAMRELAMNYFPISLEALTNDK
jgi:thymidylate synthase (FAD)